MKDKNIWLLESTINRLHLLAESKNVLSAHYVRENKDTLKEILTLLTDIYTDETGRENPIPA